MSDTLGPCQARIESLWDQAWKAIGEGKPYQFFLAQTAAELTKFRDQIPAGDFAALTDYNRSEVSDRSHRAHFTAHEARLDSERQLFASLRDSTMQNAQKAGFFRIPNSHLRQWCSRIGHAGLYGQGRGGSNVTRNDCCFNFEFGRLPLDSFIWAYCNS